MDYSLVVDDVPSFEFSKLTLSEALKECLKYDKTCQLRMYLYVYMNGQLIMRYKWNKVGGKNCRKWILIEAYNDCTESIDAVVFQT